jgi:hypothetical protein
MNIYKASNISWVDSWLIKALIVILKFLTNIFLEEKTIIISRQNIGYKEFVLVK